MSSYEENSNKKNYSHNSDDWENYDWISINSTTFYKGLLDGQGALLKIGCFVYTNHETPISVYCGEFDTSYIPNGQGLVVYRNGKIYEGNIVNGTLHGEGITKTGNLEI